MNSHTVALCCNLLSPHNPPALIHSPPASQSLLKITIHNTTDLWCCPFSSYMPSSEVYFYASVAQMKLQCRALLARNLLTVSTWRPERDSNLLTIGRKAPNPTTEPPRPFCHWNRSVTPRKLSSKQAMWPRSYPHLPSKRLCLCPRSCNHQNLQSLTLYWQLSSESQAHSRLSPSQKIKSWEEKPNYRPISNFPSYPSTLKECPLSG